MTNHTHLIVVPSDERLFARAIGEAHRRYTWMKNFSGGVHGYLFRGRVGDPQTRVSAKHLRKEFPANAFFDA